MPRVDLKKKEYKLQDFKKWVKMQMAAADKTQKDVGKALGLSQGRISQMLKVPEKGERRKDEKIEPDPFSYGQVLTLCDFFGASREEKERLLTL